MQGFTIAAHPVNKAAAKVGSGGREDAAVASEHPAKPKGNLEAGNKGYMERFGKHEGEQSDAAAPPKFPPTLISFKPPDYTL